MKSKVLRRFVHIEDCGKICMCSKGFSKTCPVRISNNFDCTDTIVRLTPVLGVYDIDTDDNIACEKIPAVNEFSKTLEHLGKMR